MMFNLSECCKIVLFSLYVGGAGFTQVFSLLTECAKLDQLNCKTFFIPIYYPDVLTLHPHTSSGNLDPGLQGEGGPHEPTPY